MATVKENVEVIHHRALKHLFYLIWRDENILYSLVITACYSQSSRNENLVDKNMLQLPTGVLVNLFFCSLLWFSPAGSWELNSC